MNRLNMKPHKAIEVYQKAAAAMDFPPVLSKEYPSVEEEEWAWRRLMIKRARRVKGGTDSELARMALAEAGYDRYTE